MQLAPRHNRVTLAVVAAVAMATMLATPAEANWWADLWFELGASYAPIEPQLSAPLQDLGVDLPVTGIDYIAGFEGALHLGLDNRIGVFLRSGYQRGSVDVPENPRGVFLPGYTGVYQDEDRITIVPVDVGVDLRLQRTSWATVFELSGGVRFVEHMIHFSDGRSSTENQQTSSFQGSVGIEWNPAVKFLGGIRAGYRLSDGIDFQGFSVDGEGYFAALYVGYKPWAPPN